MSTNEIYTLVEVPPVKSLIPALATSLELSEKQIEFLVHAIRDLNYDNIDATRAEIRDRVLEVQRKAYETYPYPCIYAFHHVALFMSANNAFAHILKVGQSAKQVNAPVLLDIGCCSESPFKLHPSIVTRLRKVGTDLRYLVQSGYPSTSVVGCDIRREFIDLGHMLYGDRDRCAIPFFVGDVFDITVSPFSRPAGEAGPSLKDVRSLNELRGRVKYVYTGAFFHLFDEGTQEAIAQRLVTLLDVTEGNGPMIVFGRHVGKHEEGVIDDTMGQKRYAHSPASWRKLWERVLGEKYRVRAVDAELRANPVKALLPCNPSLGTEIMWWSVWVD